jgi:hypothetical protein
VRTSAKQHPSNEICCGNARSSFDHLEATSGFHIAIAVLSAAVRRDIISVNNIFAAIMGDPGQ